jgi:U3 small nucleolar RNA-associated protein 25
MLCSILLGEDKQNVVNKKRFYDDFGGDHLSISQKKSRPEDYELTFAGNIDDNFKIGIAVTKKSLKVRTVGLF